jgi:hypothetical protein
VRADAASSVTPSSNTPASPCRRAPVRPVRRRSRPNAPENAAAAQGVVPR